MPPLRIPPPILTISGLRFLVNRIAARLRWWYFKDRPHKSFTEEVWQCF